MTAASAGTQAHWALKPLPFPFGARLPPLGTLASTPRSLLAYLPSSRLPIDDQGDIKASKGGGATSVLTCWPSYCKLWEPRNRLLPFPHPRDTTHGYTWLQKDLLSMCDCKPVKMSQTNTQLCRRRLEELSPCTKLGEV